MGATKSSREWMGWITWNGFNYLEIRDAFIQGEVSIHPGKDLDTLVIDGWVVRKHSMIFRIPFGSKVQFLFKPPAREREEE